MQSKHFSVCDMKQLAARVWSAVTGGSSDLPGSGAEAESFAVDAVCAAALSGHEDRVWNLAWHPRLPLLASCSGDKTVRVWSHDVSYERWSLVATLEGEHQRTVRHVEWSPSGELLACSSFDSTVSMWRLTIGDDESAIRYELDVVTILEGHENEVKNCRWAPTTPPSDAVVATCSRDKTVWVWERASPDEPEFDCAGVLSGHSQDVKSVCWLSQLVAPSGHLSLLSCSYDGTVKLWEENRTRKDDWFCAQTLHHGTLGTVWECVVDPTARSASSCVVCAATEGGSLRAWVLNRNKQYVAAGDLCVSTTAPVFSVDWSASGNLIAAGSGDDHITFSRLLPIDPNAAAEGNVPFEVVGRIYNAHDDVNCVRFAPASTDPDVLVLASCGDDSMIRIWKLRKKSGTGHTNEEQSSEQMSNNS